MNTCSNRSVLYLTVLRKFVITKYLTSGVCFKYILCSTNTPSKQHNLKHVRSQKKKLNEGQKHFTHSYRKTLWIMSIGNVQIYTWHCSDIDVSPKEKLQHCLQMTFVCNAMTLTVLLGSTY